MIKTVLIAEDDNFLGKIYKNRLEKEGLTVTLVPNGKEAIKELEVSTPDLFLLDLIMPIMDGFDTLEELKNKKLLDNLSIIVLTNLGQTDDIDKIKEYGVKKYLIKSDSTLPDIIDQIINYK